MDQRESPPSLSREALALTGVGVWSWEPSTNTVTWSAEAERLFGYEPGTLPNTFADDLGLQKTFAGVRARTDAQTDSSAARVRFARWLPAQDGTPKRWIEGHGQVAWSEAGEVVSARGVVLDRTTDKLAEDEAKETLRQLNIVRALSSDYVYEVDFTREGPLPRVIAGSFKNTTGYDETMMEPHEWQSVIYEEDRAVERIVWDAIDRRQSVVVEYRIHDGWGGMRWLRDRIVPVVEMGHVQSVLGIVQDITERKLLEEQLVHSQKMEALAQMAGSVAHDFNNLLTVMVASLEAVRQGVDQQGAIADLDDALTRGSEIAQSLLAFGRRQVAVLTSMELRQALTKALGIVQRAVGDTVKVLLELGEIPLQVEADLGQLELILLNLVINARDSAPSDHLVRIRLRKVRFGQTDPERPAELAPGDYAEISIIDAGQGMPASVKGRIFEPFYTTKEPGHGTGLGLSTVHGIVKSWGGALRVESEVDKGTTLSVLLPVAERSRIHATVASPSRMKIGGSELVLLVDDDPLVRRAALRALGQHGYHVREYASAEGLLEANDDPLRDAALLLSDVRLGGLDGISLARELTIHKPELRVLLMSGYVEHQAQQAILGAGQFGFLPKPFTPEGLIHKVREVLDRTVIPTE